MNIEIVPLALEDIPFLNETRNLVAGDFLHDSRKFTLEESYAWFNNQKPNYWLIKYKDQKIGYFRISNHSKVNKNLYIGADIHPEYQGNGLGYQSYLKFISFLFNHYDLHKISLEVLENNCKAIYLYTKLGFKYEGVKREEVLKENTYINSIIMSLLKNEWKHN